MRVVFLSGCNIQQRKIINSLVGARDIELSVVRLMPDRVEGQAKSKLKRLLQNPLKKILGKVESWNFSRRESARSHFMQQRFGAQELLAPETLRLARKQINSADAVAQIANLRPEILIVCGAPIVKLPIISLASRAALNIHFGSAPRYRGEHCLFWALLRGDFEHVQVTVHQLTAALDHGAIYLQGRPQLACNMPEFEIEARLVEYVCGELGKLVGAIGRTEISPVEPIESKSELFKLRDRTLLSDLRYWLASRPDVPLAALPR